MKTENIRKASHSAKFLTEEIRAAHSDAIAAGNQFAEIALLELVELAAALEHKINRAMDAASTMLVEAAFPAPAPA